MKHAITITLFLTTALSSSLLNRATSPAPFSGLDVKLYTKAGCKGDLPNHEANVQYNTYFPTKVSVQSYSLGRNLLPNEVLNFSTFDNGQLFVPLNGGGGGHKKRQDKPKECGFQFESAVVGRQTGCHDLVSQDNCFCYQLTQK